jgi:hypothetical protein
VFVDDVRKNLLPIEHHPQWIPVHYKGGTAKGRIATIERLDELPGLIERTYASWDKDGRVSHRPRRG